MDESGMTLIYFRKVFYRDEPFIMAEQASQNFYVKDHVSNQLYVVLQGKKKIDVNKENLVIFILLTPIHLKQ